MSAPISTSMTALALTAGGARGAYQAGVLQRISELPALAGQPSPFQIITGASAGAINGAALAAFSSDFRTGAQRLAELWAALATGDVFRTDARALAGNGLRLALDFALGGFGSAGRTTALLDAAPLRAFLARHLPLDGVARSIARGDLYALAVTATGYQSGRAFTFIEGQPGHPLWRKSRRIALPTRLTLDHILASAAIPLVFAPVPLRDGPVAGWFGDGALRLTTPLSPAIRLGAGRLLAIGVRCRQAADSRLRAELSERAELASPRHRPPLAQVCGILMNAIFLDHLDADLDHLIRMNSFVAAYHHCLVSNPDYAGPEPVHATSHEPLRRVEPLAIHPSVDIGEIARDHEHRLPRLVRHALEALGEPDIASADLVSYLLFDAAYTRELIALGYADAGRRIDEIAAFLAPDA